MIEGMPASIRIIQSSTCLSQALAKKQIKIVTPSEIKNENMQAKNATAKFAIRILKSPKLNGSVLTSQSPFSKKSKRLTSAKKLVEFSSKNPTSKSKSMADKSVKAYTPPLKICPVIGYFTGINPIFSTVF